jgi:hypothetical protein
MSLGVDRAILYRIAADCERLAECAELISDSRRRLTLLDNSFGAAPMPVDQSASSRHVREKITAYEDMAADAVALSKLALLAVGERWCEMAMLWTKLADDVERERTRTAVSQAELSES